MEHSERWIIGGGVPCRIVQAVGSDLHEHDSAGDPELQVILKIDGQLGQRHHIRIGGQLEQHAVVQMQYSEHQFLVEVGGQDTHRSDVLPDYAESVIIDVVGEQGVSHSRIEFPARYGQPALHPRHGLLGEVVVPLEMVGVDMLEVVLRLIEAGVEMQVDAQRALPCPAERIDAESEVGVNAHVVDLITEEDVFALGIPVDIVAQASFDSRVQVSRVPYDIVVFPGECRVECIVGEHAVSHSDVELGDYGVFCPRLEP